MGLTSSRNIPPVASIPDSYIAVSICRWATEVRVMNATQDVEEMLVRLDQELIAKSGVNRGPLVNYHGTLKIIFGSISAVGRNMSSSGVLISANMEYFGLRLIEEMYNLGYNLMISSDLARYADNGTWFFAKSEIVGEKRAPARVCVITPGSGLGYQSNNKLILMRHDEKIKTAVKLAIEDGWPSGVTKSEDYTTLGEKVHVLSFGGLWGYIKEAGIHSRKTICSLVGRMGELHWRLLSSSNLRGAGDAYFFIYDPAFSATPSDFCMLALAKKNRLRLINCYHLLEPLEKAITLAGFSVLEKIDYHGCYEIKILGTPWWTNHGPQAAAACRSLSRVMEVFGQHSYTPLYAIDVSRRPTEKGSILFRRNPFPMNSKYACLSLHGANTLRLLDFPPDVRVSMKEALYQFYPMGVRNEVHLPDSNLEINVLAMPWSQLPNNYNNKAGCQLHMRGVLGKMMAIAAQFGWHVSISADVSCAVIGKQKKPVDVNSLYFVKLM